MLFVFFFCILLCTQEIISTEYIYPVASLDDVTILYIHQISSQNIQLFQWNTTTNHTEQILWSLSNPAGIQMLPNNRGFSFIDNGRLRIKIFQKRSPKTIDFEEPIANINGLRWIDEHICYCSAYYNNHFSIFELHDDGDVYYVIKKENADCMYPQKINDQLFYIERSKKGKDNNHTIMQTLYKQNNSACQQLVSFENNPIIFLHMISETEGFVLEHQKDIDRESTTAGFQYHHIWKEDDSWHISLLFSFKIPTCLFLYNNEERLFESILPLLPRIINDKIYFVDCSDSYDNTLQLYCYGEAKVNKIAMEKQKGHCFVPVQCGSKVCFGGIKTEENPFLFVF